MKNKVQRSLYKINSKRFRLNKWNLELRADNTLPDEIVKVSDNQILEFLRQIKGINLDDEQHEIYNLKRNIKKRVNVSKSVDRLNEITFIPEICFVVMDRISDYHKLNTKMILNGKNFKRLLATTGGVKASTVAYVEESVHDELQRRIDNSRDESVAFNPAKLEAYKSLTFSNSRRVSDPRNIVIVNDSESSFIEDKVIELDDYGLKYPSMTIKENYPIKLEASDGFCVMSMQYAKRLTEELRLSYQPSGFLVRNSFLKGMCYPMDIERFASEIGKTDEITDIYGKTYKVKDVDMIIPKSVFKLWQSYESSESYMENCKANGYTFRVAKVTPKTLDNRRNLNYQFIQTLKMNDDDIEELCSYTIDNIKDIVNNDYIKTLLFTRGKGLSTENWDSGLPDYTRALMVDKRMLHDPFVKSKVVAMINKKINDAKIGILSVRGNFQILSGDIFYFLESCFDIENPKGLIKANEVYSRYWIDRGIEDIALFRAPMSCHNNIRKVKAKTSDEMDKWFGHLGEIMIISAFDTITHALNGADLLKSLKREVWYISC